MLSHMHAKAAYRLANHIVGRTDLNLVETNGFTSCLPVDFRNRAGIKKKRGMKSTHTDTNMTNQHYNAH